MCSSSSSLSFSFLGPFTLTSVSSLFFLFFGGGKRRMHGWVGKQEMWYPPCPHHHPPFKYTLAREWDTPNLLKDRKHDKNVNCFFSKVFFQEISFLHIHPCMLPPSRHPPSLLVCFFFIHHSSLSHIFAVHLYRSIILSGNGEWMKKVNGKQETLDITIFLTVFHSSLLQVRFCSATKRRCNWSTNSGNCEFVLGGDENATTSKSHEFRCLRRRSRCCYLQNNATNCHEFPHVNMGKKRRALSLFLLLCLPPLLEEQGNHNWSIVNFRLCFFSGKKPLQQQ